jgi:hypothetical protein
MANPLKPLKYPAAFLALALSLAACKRDMFACPDTGGRLGDEALVTKLIPQLLEEGHLREDTAFFSEEDLIGSPGCCDVHREDSLYAKGYSFIGSLIQRPSLAVFLEFPHPEKQLKIKVSIRSSTCGDLQEAHVFERQIAR